MRINMARLCRELLANETSYLQAGQMRYDWGMKSAFPILTICLIGAGCGSQASEPETAPPPSPPSPQFFDEGLSVKEIERRAQHVGTIIEFEKILEEMQNEHPDVPEIPNLLHYGPTPEFYEMYPELAPSIPK